MRPSCLLPLLLLLLLATSRAQPPPAATAAAHAAADNCTVVERGKLAGLMGVHTEMLLPGQHSLVLHIPTVCSRENGVRVVACEVAAAAPSVALRGGGGGDGGSGGRAVTLLRRGDAADFAVLSVALYCRPPPAPPSALPSAPPHVHT